MADCSLMSMSLAPTRPPNHRVFHHVSPHSHGMPWVWSSGPLENQGFYANKVPTPMMEKSLLYKLVEHNNKEGVRVNESLGSGFPWHELSCHVSTPVVFPLFWRQFSSIMFRAAVWDDYRLSLGITWPCIGFVISLFLFARCPSRASPKSSMGYAEEAVQARAHDQTWPPVASLTGYRWLSMATGHPPLTTGKPHSKLVPPISEQN